MKRGEGNHLTRQRKSKAQRGLETVVMVYASLKRPHAPHQELKVDVRRGTIIDTDHATGLVAVRATLPLDEVRIIKIKPC